MTSEEYKRGYRDGFKDGFNENSNQSKIKEQHQQVADHILKEYYRNLYEQMDKTIPPMMGSAANTDPYITRTIYR